MWDGDSWVDELIASVGDEIMFRLELQNDGGVENVDSIQVIDNIPTELVYLPLSGTLSHNGVQINVEPRDYCMPIDSPTGGIDCLWDLIEIDYLAPGDTLAIEYSAIVDSAGTFYNSYYAYASCSACDVDLSFEDTAVVTVS